MRTIGSFLRIAALTILAVALAGCVSHVGIVTEPEPKSEKVYVCHKGKKTLEVGKSALDAHLRHGDTSGPCP